MPLLTLSNLDKFNDLVSNNEKLIVIDFTASWCGPCKRIAPQYIQFSEKMPNIIFCKVDINKAESIAKNFNIKSIPTFIFIKKGKIIDRFGGSDMSRVYSLCQKYN